MDSGFLRLLSKGGPWSQFLVIAYPLWLLALFALVLWQRRRLARRLDQAVEESAFAAGDNRGDAIEATVDRFTAGLGPYALGGPVTALVAIWWLVSLGAYLWSLASVIDITRMHDEAYLASVTWDRDARQVAAAQSAALITRSFVGILGCPAAIISLLALDQALLRPRTRLLEELRHRLFLTGGDAEAEADEAWRRRLRASWSWQAQFFSWIWLFVKGLPRHAAVVFLIYVAISIGTSIAAQWVQVPEPDFMAPVPTDFDPRWVYFGSPTLALLIQYLPAMALAVVVAARGHGWLADRRREDSGRD